MREGLRGQDPIPFLALQNRLTRPIAVTQRIFATTSKAFSDAREVPVHQQGGPFGTIDGSRFAKMMKLFNFAEKLDHDDRPVAASFQIPGVGDFEVYRPQWIFWYQLIMVSDE